MIWYGMVEYGMVKVWFDKVQYGMVTEIVWYDRYFISLYGRVLFSIVWHGRVWHG